MNKKIAIIGAGIAGLTLANLIKKYSDHEFMVYEREESLSLDEGYGIQLAVNSIKILNQINVKSKFSKGELKIYGQGRVNASSKKIIVPNKGDHRLCMSGKVLALLTGAKTTINNFETVFTSSPSFLKIMKSLGAKFEIKR